MPTISQQATYLQAVQNVRKAGPGLRAVAAAPDREEIEI
jgi:hypothetical protein